METILNFEFNSQLAKWKTGQFKIAEMKIVGSKEDQEITWDTIELYLDGERYSGGINTFTHNNVSVDFLFDSVLNSYLRNNTEEYSKFDEGWSIFKSIESMKEWDGDLLIKLPFYNGFGIDIYELELETPLNKYYRHYEDCLLLNSDNGIITDMETFYSSAFTEDLAEVLQGKIKCLYMSDEVKQWVKEEGEANIIAEYGKN